MSTAPKRHVERPPALVAEILPAATRDRDLTVERELYAANGVRWYLVVDPDGPESSLQRLGDTGRYESLAVRGRHEIDLCPDWTIAVDFRV